MADKSKTERGKKTKYTTLPEKKFVIRNSLLTDLFENPHIETIYHIFAAILIGFIVNTIAHDLLTTGDAKLGFQIVLLGFGKIHLSLLIWLGIFTCSCLCYLCFLIWGRIRINLKPKSLTLSLWDTFWWAVTPVYYIFSFKTAAQLVTELKLPPASAAIVLFETVRLCMKSHAFIRENAGKVLKYKIKSEDPLNLPSFSKFLYFSFAPTLVYRDEYPRTKEIRWKYVATRLFEVICIVLNIGYLLERLIRPTFNTFGERNFTVVQFLLSICEMSYAGMLLKLYVFYFMLHSWSNLWAEMLKFGDRQFYLSWWTATSYGEYFRTWNILVGDWLYSYVYKDMYEIVVPRNKFLAKLAVFITSAIVHEWIMCYMLGFFLPIMFMFFFFFSGPLSFIKAPRLSILNILFWYGLAFGSGAMVCCYTMELYVRINIPIETGSFRDFFIPRMFNYITL